MPAATPATPPAATARPRRCAAPPRRPGPTGQPTASDPDAGTGSAQIVNSQKPDQWLASKFKGTDVVGADNEKIGDVSATSCSTRPARSKRSSSSVGGFLGMGAKDVALAPASFEVVPGDKSKNESDKLKLSMTKDQLKQAANFEPYKEPRTTTGMGGGTRPRRRAGPAAR